MKKDIELKRVKKKGGRRKSRTTKTEKKPRTARIRLSSRNVRSLEKTSEHIVSICEMLEANKSGPIPLPTKKIRVPVRKSPDGEGTATWDRYEMRIHKRLIDIKAGKRTSQQLMHRIMRLEIPEEVNIEIELER